MNATTTTDLGSLVQVTEVQARFLMIGEIIERGGHLMRVVGRPIPDPFTLGRVQIVVIDLEDDDARMRPCSLNAELFMPTWDSI